MLNAVQRAIGCPVEWCTGSLIDHGGVGDAPEHWVHSDGAGRDLGDAWSLCRTQTASGPTQWHLYTGSGDAITAASRREIAEYLRRMANLIEQEES